mmetsp:Transcript_8153/g.17757  ORF Transcript_8153/g.17757 Transcript_8153/m.17757 type:complete len:292 (-) Transcript_8153:97-972(-)
MSSDGMRIAPERKTRMWKTKICMLYAAGNCNRDHCRFAHGDDELVSTPDLVKTRLCPEFRHGRCRLGSACKFAHGRHELREGLCYKTQICWSWQTGNCRQGDLCMYAHGEHELRAPATADGAQGQQNTKTKKTKGTCAHSPKKPAPASGSLTPLSEQSTGAPSTPPLASADCSPLTLGKVDLAAQAINNVEDDHPLRTLVEALQALPGQQVGQTAASYISELLGSDAVRAGLVRAGCGGAARDPVIQKMETCLTVQGGEVIVREFAMRVSGETHQVKSLLQGATLRAPPGL